MVFIALHVTVHTRLQACPLALSSASCLVDYLPFHSRHAAETQSSSDSLSLLQCTVTSSKSCLFRRAEQWLWDRWELTAIQELGVSNMIVSIFFFVEECVACPTGTFANQSKATTSSSLISFFYLFLLFAPPPPIISSFSAGIDECKECKTPGQCNGTDSCTKCMEGEYNDKEGQTACKPCEKGYFAG